MRWMIFFALADVVASGAHAQSFNVDFGTPIAAPSPTYGGAGPAGEWNTFEVLPEFVRFPLVDTNGDPSPARIYQAGGVEMLVSDDASTTGDDEALLDDMLIGFNDPVDVCLWVENLTPGDYHVITYALTPNDPSLLHRVRVDDSPDGPVWIGGAWPGAHVDGVSYTVHAITVTTGSIGFHSGLWAGEIESGINGFQICPASAVSVEPAEAQTGMRAFPNPMRAGVGVTLEWGTAPTRVDIFDAAGRRVRHMLNPGASLRWDGTTTSGFPVAPGVYFARTARGESARLTVVR